MKTLTIKELIELLQKYPGDTEVHTEGCDCYGDANGVTMNKDGYLLITRNQ
jgi:hypothetical protein